MKRLEATIVMSNHIIEKLNELDQFGSLDQDGDLEPVKEAWEISSQIMQ